MIAVYSTEKAISIKNIARCIVIPAKKEPDSADHDRGDGLAQTLRFHAVGISYFDAGVSKGTVRGGAEHPASLCRSTAADQSKALRRRASLLIYYDVVANQKSAGIYRRQPVPTAAAGCHRSGAGRFRFLSVSPVSQGVEHIRLSVQFGKTPLCHPSMRRAGNSAGNCSRTLWLSGLFRFFSIV